jgi:ATP-binding cassette, subfamily C, bacterial CydC
LITVDGARALGRVVRAMDLDPWRVGRAAVLGAGAQAGAVALIGTSGWLIARAAQHPPVLQLMVAVVAVRTFGLGRGVLRYVERLAGHDVALRGIVDLRCGLYARLAAADPAVAAGLRRGDLLTRLGEDVEAVGDVVVRSLLPFASSVLTLIGAVVATALILPGAGLVLAAGAVVAALVAPSIAAAAGARELRDGVTSRAALGAEVLGLLDALPELTIAGAAEGRLDRIDRIEEERSRLADRAARPAAWACALAASTMGVTAVAVLTVGTQAVASGRLTPVMLAVVALIPLALADVVVPLPAAATTLVRAGAAAGRLASLLDVPARERPARAAVPGPGARGPARLQARGLRCGYPGRASVREVELDLPAGHRLAVVGPSGAGKTTLLTTLAGLLPPLDGRVLLDGVDLSGLDPARVRSTIHLGAEGAHVFATTVRENLRVARPGAEDADLVRALEAARLGGWLRGLPAGLDTMIADPGGPGAGPGARLLSGGERRRLLVARALLSEADIVLIDEPAEHLDPLTADALLGELFASGRSVVAVTHRLTPLHAADEVVVVEGGRIAARGSHDHLIATHPPYRDAWLSEQGAVVDDAEPHRRSPL